jgi:hypothetical protein
LGDELTTAPFSVQFANVNPKFGAAVTVRELPKAKLPPPPAVPSLLGCTPTVRAKLATGCGVGATINLVWFWTLVDICGEEVTAGFATPLIVPPLFGKELVVVG